jgi:hypothetical protein
MKKLHWTKMIENVKEHDYNNVWGISELQILLLKAWIRHKSGKA